MKIDSCFKRGIIITANRNSLELMGDISSNGILGISSCRAFFGSLYRCLGRGARAVFQLYPENNAQRELILSFAMRAGFSGGVVIDYPHRYLLFFFTQNVKDL